MDGLNITPMDIYNENEDDLDIDTIIYYLLKGGELDEVPEKFITQEHLYYSLQSISDKILAGKGKEISPVVTKFIQRYLGIGAKKKINSSKIRLSYDEYYAASWGANWLKYFRFDEKYKNVNGKITTIKYIGEDGSQIEITKEMAEEVISILIENDIQPINCIVNTALLKYAGGNLEQLITQIKSYDNYKSETEKNARRR